ncbi:MAG: protein kinase domain-containing protein [Gemmataceae bacterium]
MTVQSACPRAGDFERLLKRGIAASESQLLLDHLETCPDCWQTVAPLLDGDTLLSGVSAGRPVVTAELFDQLIGLLPANSTDELGALSATPADFGDADAALPAPSAVIAHYRIVRLLGRGGMGAVYLATDLRLDRSVALKVMLPRFAASAQAKERFLREARAVGQISNDHVVTVYEAAEYDGVPYIAMQFLQGTSLEERLRRDAEFTPAQVLRIAEEAAEGLAAAHAIGLVHRDIKPANLWLEEPSGRVKVLDFGLAKPCDAVQLTGSGTLIGTPAFMSPEQGRGKNVDARTDLFSLGVVLYRLSTGRLPFEGPNAMAILTALAVDSPPPVRSLNPRVPEPLATLINDLLAKDPNKRPESAAEVVERVRRITTGQPEPVRARTQRMPLNATGLFALLALVAAGVIIIIKNKDGSERKIDVPNGATVTVKDGEGKTLAKVAGLTNAEWEKSVAALKGDDLMDAVSERLTQLNPRFHESALNPRVENDAVVALVITDASDLPDLSPLRALTTLKDLYINGQFRNPADISPLRGLKLTSFQANGCPIKDISPLAGMPLFRANFWGNKTADISPLRGMKLTNCNVGHSPTKDISVLKGMPLEDVCLNISQIEDLSPLAGAPIKRLAIEYIKATDLAPLAKMPLEALFLKGTPIKDYSLLRTLPLKEISLDDPKRHAELLRAIPTLKTINLKPADEILGDQ